MKVQSKSCNKKYCQFYYDYDHNIKQCIQLRNEIEAMIRRGYLEKFIHGKAPQADAPAPDEIDNRSTGALIGMVSWGADLARRS